MPDTKLAPKPVAEIVETNPPAIDIKKTPRSWLKSAGVKACPECGEGVHSRKNEDGKTEVFCPAGKPRCSFVKNYGDVVDKLNGMKIDDLD